MRQNVCMRSGFSLVELSIVLVILGLLTGGILAGQSLIRAAELRSVTSEADRYRTAAHTFRDKYFYIPGDFNAATKFWGIRTGSSSTTGSDNACVSVLNVASGTCNGNGDGRIGDNAGPWALPYNLSERFLFWQHLGLAGLIEGSYSGSVYNTSGANSPQGYSPANMPPSRLSGAFWYASYNFPGIPSGFTDYVATSNVLAPNPYSGVPSVMTPAEAWNIDIKTDDGKPGYGWTYAYKSTSGGMPNCVTTDLAATAEYRVQDSSKICSLIFRLD